MPYITPLTAPTDYTCRRLFIPDSVEWRAIVSGAITELAKVYRWEQIDGISAEEAAAVAMQIHIEREDSPCMIGLITPYITLEAPPGTLECDGTTHLRVDYPRLYDVLHPALILDDDHFMTPAMGGRFVLGSYDGGDAFETGGTASVALNFGQIPRHSHIADPHDHTTIPHTHGEGIAVPTVINGGLEAPAASTTPGVSVTSAETVIVNASVVTMSEVGNDEHHTNMPPYIVFSYCVVAR